MFLILGTNIEAQWIKPLLTMLVSPMGATLSPSYSAPHPEPANMPNMQGPSTWDQLLLLSWIKFLGFELILAQSGLLQPFGD